MKIKGIEVLTLVEAGERIGVSPHTLRRSAEAGTLHADKKGKTWLVTADELDRYARENKGKPGRKPKGIRRASAE
jgi:excisionase family DNA binding protein